MKFSNKSLALLVILAMSLSLFSTLSLINSIQKFFPRPVELTGKAPTALGEVNLTVQQLVSIILWNNTIDFGAGTVNNTQPCNNATVSIEWAGGPTGSYSDPNDCWINSTGGQPSQPSYPFTIENDGNENVTLTITGPTPTDFFTASGPPAVGPEFYNLSWAGENMDNGCTSGLITAWTSFNGSEQTICDNNYFGFVAGDDDLAVNIRVQIPAQGIDKNQEYKNDSIVFTATVV